MVSECRPFVGTDEAGEGWAALGDPTRRAIVESLAERPRAVGELADELPVSRPAVSLALKVLKDAGLVTDRAAVTRRIYRLNPTAVAALRDQLDTYWNRALAGYQDAVASPDDTAPAGERGVGGEQDATEAPGQESPGPGQPPPPSASRSSSPRRSSGPSRCSPPASATSSRRNT